MCCSCISRSPSLSNKSLKQNAVDNVKSKQDTVKQNKCKWMIHTPWVMKFSDRYKMHLHKMDMTVGEGVDAGNYNGFGEEAVLCADTVTGTMAESGMVPIPQRPFILSSKKMKSLMVKMDPPQFSEVWGPRSLELLTVSRGEPSVMENHPRSASANQQRLLCFSDVHGEAAVKASLNRAAPPPPPNPLCSFIIIADETD